MPGRSKYQALWNPLGTKRGNERRAGGAAAEEESSVIKGQQQLQPQGPRNPLAAKQGSKRGASEVAEVVEEPNVTEGQRLLGLRAL